MLVQVLEQIGLAALYYAGLVVLVRLAGKRLAGQTTTFDLLILISLGVTLQNVTLEEGRANALIFIATVFILHKLLALGCARSPLLRKIVRGGPRPLIKDGCVLTSALHAEGLSEDDLLAALRKLGYDSVEAVKCAVLEETGHISAVPLESKTA